MYRELATAFIRVFWCDNSNDIINGLISSNNSGTVVLWQNLDRLIDFEKNGSWRFHGPGMYPRSFTKEFIEELEETAAGII